MRKILVFITSIIFLFSSCSQSSQNIVSEITSKSSYSIQYESNGGNILASQVINNGELIEIPLAPSKESYIFDGWFTDQTLKKEWNFYSEYPSSDMKLYAKWILKEDFLNRFINFSEVQGGTYMMGSEIFIQGANINRLHQVTLSNFYINKYEVTFEAYNTFCRATNRYFVYSNLRGYYPVNKVKRVDALSYANWVSSLAGYPNSYNENTGELLDENGNITNDITKVKGFRLPTEAEWEYSARNKGQSITFPWGNKFLSEEDTNVANVADESAKLANYLSQYSEYFQGYNDGFSGLAPVGSFPSNELGLYDMGGNVAEWVYDTYMGSFSPVSVTNPIGDVNGFAICRGGSYLSGDSSTRNVYRTILYGENDSYRETIGFRLAKSKD